MAIFTDLRSNTSADTMYSALINAVFYMYCFMSKNVLCGYKRTLRCIINIRYLCFCLVFVLYCYDMKPCSVLVMVILKQLSHRSEHSMTLSSLHLSMISQASQGRNFYCVKQTPGTHNMHERHVSITFVFPYEQVRAAIQHARVCSTAALQNSSLTYFFCKPLC